MVSPLIDLLKGCRTRKTVKFTTKGQTALEELKNVFTSAPMLKMPDPNKFFVIDVDASEVRLGAMLSK